MLSHAAEMASGPEGRLSEIPKSIRGTKIAKELPCAYSMFLWEFSHHKNGSALRWSSHQPVPAHRE